jgi:hypothetical protein
MKSDLPLMLWHFSAARQQAARIAAESRSSAVTLRRNM